MKRKTNLKRCVVIAVILVGAVSANALCDVIYVDDNATGSLK